MNELNLSKLNKEQRLAVETTEGPLLVLAGAGSGKTRVLTHRIAYLIERGLARPSSVLALTFTNKAAQEMRDRLETLLGAGSTTGMWVTTFHSCCVRILRRDIEVLGYDPHFVIYDDSDQQSLIKQLIKQANLNDKVFTPRTIASTISDAKNHSLDPVRFMHDAYAPQEIIDLFVRYEKEMKRNNALDFDDLLLKTLQLFETHPEILARYQERFSYILVDEYQDTNITQYEIVRLLAARHRNLCVVGDDDQSIYGWRGADIRNILEFEKDFPGANVIRLEQNYRSTEAILNAANLVISNNKNRKSKRLWTENKGGMPLSLREAADERDEAMYIANTIAVKVRNEHRQYDDFAILYRTHAQSRIIEMLLKSYAIPYRIYGGLSFFQRAETKDILCYLRLLSNAKDDGAFMRIFNVPKRGLGDAALGVIRSYAEENGLSLFSAAMACPNIPARYKKSIDSFIGAFVRAETDLACCSLVETVENLLESIGYDAYLREEKKDSYDVCADIVNELINYISEYEKAFDDPEADVLEAFLENVALFTSTDMLEAEAGQVTMMTLHSAKGLEFPVVFLCGMEDGLFPSSRSNTEPDKLEEERRLCYVGITRAKEELLLSYADQRMIFGSIEPSMPSPFLEELKEALPEPPPKKSKSLFSSFDFADTDYSFSSSGSVRYGHSQSNGDSTRSGRYQNNFTGGYSKDNNGRKVFSGNGSSSKTAASSFDSKQSPSVSSPQLPKKPDIPKPTIPKADFKTGQRVKHNIFGSGTIISIQNQIVEIDFDKGITKKLALGYAPLVPLEDK